MPGAASGVAGELAGIPLLEGLEDEVLAILAGAASYLSARSEERIYWQGEQPSACYHVLSGHVRRSLASPEGEEKIIDVLAAGEGFGFVELVGNVPYVSFAAATETSMLLRIERAGWMDAIEASPLLSLRVMAAAAERQAVFETNVASCFFHSGGRRLVDYLLRQAGSALDLEGETTFQLPITKRLIAASIGVSAETLSRLFRTLSDAGLLRVRGREVTLLGELARRDTAVCAEPARRPRWGIGARSHRKAGGERRSDSLPSSTAAGL